MRYITTVALLFFLCSFSGLWAQKFELGKVTSEELKQKSHPLDSSASAAVLYKKARTTFKYNEKNGFSTIHEYEFRIKIYKTEGLSRANFKVPYYIGYENLSKDVVKFSDAITYNLENDKIVKTKLNNEGSFKEDVNEYWAQASIMMPNVKAGSVIEFKYILKSEKIIDFPVFDFQESIPVNFAEYKTEIPGFFIYKTVLKGSFKVKSDSKMVNGFQNYAGDHSSESHSLNYKQINTVYSAENIPALNEEIYVDNINNYKSSLQNELQNTNFANEPIKDYSLSWEGVAKSIFEEKEFGKELNESNYYENELRSYLKVYLKSDATDTDKVNSILVFVKNKMKWNGDKGYLTDKGVKKAFVDGTGNVAEINFMLIAMLKYVNINAYPVLVSTREHGIAVYPNRTNFNYVIVAVEVENKKVLLDATNKYSTLDILPLNVINWSGRLIRDNGTSEEINLVPKTLSKELVDLIVTIDPLGKIKGKTRVQKTDYEAFEFREKYAGINKENYLERLENNYNGIQISEYAIDNKSEVTKPIVETFTFTSENHAEIIGDKMFINPLLFFTQFANPFVQEKRVFPIYFAYPKQEKYNINIDIPERYVIESLPKPISLNAVDNLGKFNYKIMAIANKIQVVITKENNLAIVSADYYEVLKEFYQMMIDKQIEKIILKKI
jgi:hypothetical protein